jgi:16S rRNA (cytosine1402-N4)-methyltransferase
MEESSPHVPVMLETALEYLNVRPGLVYVDATAGAGGHLRELVRATAGTGTVIGIDRDSYSLDSLTQELSGQARLIHANFSEIGEVVDGLGISTISGGILADLGVSSMQLDDPQRGFSFLRDGPLDMRMDPTALLTAEELVNKSTEHDLASIIYKYGEERESRKIARAIVAARPLHTTGELSEIVTRCLRRQHRGAPGFRDLSHPATRTFQALRIAVNGELDSLEKFLRSSLRLLSPGGRLVVITFHSLEDRLVKQIFRQAAAQCICPPRQPICTCSHQRELLIMTRKPALPSDKEVLANPRSRSAKLRAGEKAA